MAWSSPPVERVADLERLLHDVEQRLTRLKRTAPRNPRDVPAFDRFGETIAAALGDIAGRVRNRAGSAGSDAAQLGDDALRLGNEALRRLTREVEQRPLVMLAIAAGVGALAAGLFARRA
jgi:ElaB/YqjD/DUF883 family membrane-anchored ribosome-binding protein